MVAEPTTLRAGDLELRPEEFLALVRGRPLALTVHELALLTAFVRRRGRIVGRGELYEAAWGGRLRAGDRSVDVYVRRLRRRLAGALPEWRFIHTHVGFGYRFDPQRSQLFHTAATGC